MEMQQRIANIALGYLDKKRRRSGKLFFKGATSETASIQESFRDLFE